MNDPRALVRVFDELLWVLRREGFVISTAQAIDALQAVRAVGFEDRERVSGAIAAVVVTRAAERARFEAVFDRFFDPNATGGARVSSSLWERLGAKGFTEGELDALRALLQRFGDAAAGGTFAALGVLAETGAELDRLLALSTEARDLDAHSGPQLGFLTHRLLSRVGLATARTALPALRSLLSGALGSRGDELADALAQELDETEAFVRLHLRRAYESRVDDLERQRASASLLTTPFAALTDAEIDEVRRAVRRFGESLRGGARVRARRRERTGRVDPHATLRGALRTGGVPFVVSRRGRPRDRPKLVVLCDVSESVRAAALFLLEFTYAVQELFAAARSFLFVSDLVEATRLFATEPVRVAIARAFRGEIVPAGDNSNYGRALRAFETRHGRDVDRRTTIVILGDGRTNFHDAAADVLDRLRARARAVLWLCPEPRGHWGQGDSAMALYAARCTAVHEVRSAADLEGAARALLATARR